MVEVKVVDSHYLMGIEERFSMFFTVEITAKYLLSNGPASSTSLKFVFISFFVAKHYSKTHFLCFEYRLKFSLGDPSPDSYTIGKVAFKECVI